MAVGLALAEESLRAKFKEINHYVYVICSDGDLQEGISYETLSFAGKNNLSKLIIMHDSNDCQLDTSTNLITNENLKLRMKSIGFEYILVKKNTVKAIDEAIIKAKKSNKPSFIEIKTIIGHGSSKQGTSEVHGKPLGDDIENVKKTLN
jgi:transketolase